MDRENNILPYTLMNTSQLVQDCLHQMNHVAVVALCNYAYCTVNY